MSSGGKGNGSGAGAFWGTLGLTAAASLALHAGGLAVAARLEPRAPAVQTPVEVEFEAVPAPPPPPPPLPAKELPPPPPAPKEPKKVDFAKLPRPPKDLPPPPPPPPNEPPPRDQSPSAKPAAPVVGLSLNSTVESGGFAVQAGNTLYGRANDVAASPRDVKPYAAEGTAPAQRITRPPRCLPLDERERPPYPKAAQAAGVEGLVKLLLTVDAQGQVTSARVLVEPGYGLGEAARASATRIRCSPGLLEGEPVVSDVTYGYRFTLD